MIIKELQIFSTKIKLDKNWLFYLLYINLDKKYFRYFQEYLQQQNFFDIEKNIKYTLSCTMQHFENIVINQNIVNKLILSMTFTPNTAFIHLNKTNNKTKNLIRGKSLN